MIEKIEQVVNLFHRNATALLVFLASAIFLISNWHLPGLFIYSSGSFEHLLERVNSDLTNLTKISLEVFALIACIVFIPAIGAFREITNSAIDFWKTSIMEWLETKKSIRQMEGIQSRNIRDENKVAYQDDADKKFILEFDNLTAKSGFVRAIDLLQNNSEAEITEYLVKSLKELYRSISAPENIHFNKTLQELQREFSNALNNLITGIQSAPKKEGYFEDADEEYTYYERCPDMKVEEHFAAFRNAWYNYRATAKSLLLI